MCTMDLDGSLADTEISRNHLVCLALGDEIQDFAFARTQRGESFLDAIRVPQAYAVLGIADQRTLDAVEQLLVPEWLLQEIESAVLHGFDRHRDVAVARDEDHGDRRAAKI